MKPATRFLFSGIALMVVLTAAATAGVVWQSWRSQQNQAWHQMRLAGTVENELQTNRLQELQLRAEVLAHDSAFVDYVAQSMIPNAQLGGAVDSASISDLLKERRQGYDIAAVLDPNGKLVATSGILLKDPADIRKDALVLEVIKTLKPVQGSWVDHGQLLWVAVNPLLRGGSLQGVLLSASHVDDAFAIAVGRIASTDVVFAIQPSLDGTPPPSNGVIPWASQALLTQLPQVLGITSNQMFNLADGQHHTMVWVMPLKTSGGSAALVAIDPDAGLSGPLNPAPRTMLLGVAGFSALGFLVVLMLWRRTWLPLQKMLDVVERAAHTSDQHLTVRVQGSPIVRHLRDSLNGLLHHTRPTE